MPLTWGRQEEVTPICSAFPTGVFGQGVFSDKGKLRRIRPFSRDFWDSRDSSVLLLIFGKFCMGSVQTGLEKNSQIFAIDCSRLPLSSWRERENKKKKRKRREAKKAKKWKFLQPHLHQPHWEPHKICSDLHSLFSGVPRFTLICSHFFRFLPTSYQNKSGNLVSVDPFCKSTISINFSELTDRGQSRKTRLSKCSGSRPKKM